MEQTRIGATPAQAEFQTRWRRAVDEVTLRRARGETPWLPTETALIESQMIRDLVADYLAIEPHLEQLPPEAQARMQTLRTRLVQTVGAVPAPEAGLRMAAREFQTTFDYMMPDELLRELAGMMAEARQAAGGYLQLHGDIVLPGGTKLEGMNLLRGDPAARSYDRMPPTLDTAPY